MGKIKLAILLVTVTSGIILPTSYLIAQQQQTTSATTAAEERIKRDLVGRTIMEPTKERYRSKFEIKTINNILGVEITGKEKKEKEILFNANVKLSDKVNIYIAKVNITYVWNGKSWSFQFLQSKFLDIKSTGKFNSCVSAKLVESGWGGIYTIQFTNNCDIPLLVEGVALYNEEWHYFSALVDANDSREANSGFANVKDFKIERVERP